jgi:hypothetical protein
MVLIIFLTACSGIFTTPASPTTVITETQTSTTTILWFPPTSTATIFPARTSTTNSEQQLNLGQLLFTDTFDDPSLWNISISTAVKAALSRNQLVLSISEDGPLSIISLRSQPVLTDFFAEVTARLSLCSEKNQFGMIFRATPGENYYRFTIRCDGQARFERVMNGTLSPLLDWQPSGDAPQAAPAEVKLAVWAEGSEMRFFLNDNFQFAAHTPLFPTGTLGFFAYASGSMPITVSFTNLSVFSIFTISSTPSLIPTMTPTLVRTP